MPLGADNLAKEVDTRPETSPYLTSSFKLRLKDGTVFIIPTALLRKCPTLFSPSCSSTLRLEISTDVGHILVHYLFTDTYQCLRPKGSSAHEKLAAEFTTSVRVYAFARDYKLPSLEELAKHEIESLGDKMCFSVVLDSLQTAYPAPKADDAWFSSYLKSGLKSLFENPSKLSTCGIPNAERKSLSVSDLLFKNLIEILHDHAISSQGLGVAPSVDIPKESALMMPVLELELPKGVAPETADSELITAEPIIPAEAEPECYEPATDMYEPEVANTVEPGPQADSDTELCEPAEGLSEPEEVVITVTEPESEPAVELYEPELEPGPSQPESEGESALIVQDDWSFCDSDGKDTKP